MEIKVAYYFHMHLMLGIWQWKKYLQMTIVHIFPIHCVTLISVYQVHILIFFKKILLKNKWKILLEELSFQIQKKDFYKIHCLPHKCFSTHGNVCTTVRHSFLPKQGDKIHPQFIPCSNWILYLSWKYRHSNQTLGQVNYKWFKPNITSLEVIVEFGIYVWLFLNLGELPFCILT